MIQPTDLVHDMRSRRRRSAEPVRFYWVTVTRQTEPSGRGEFAAAMRGLTSEEAVCSVALRAERFTHPDTVMNDLADTLEEVKDEILAWPLRGLVEAAGSLDVVIVSRMSFELAVTTSPLYLPEWFPVSPGRLVDASVTDLTLRVAVPLSQVGTGELCRLLFELDRALLKRIKAGMDANPRSTREFLDECRGTTKRTDSYGQLLIDIEEKLHIVKNPADYRPSTTSPTLVNQIWRMANTRSANDLVKVAESLARAAPMVAVNPDDSPEALLTVLGGPNSQRFPSRESRRAYNVITSARGACRLITAAAHADEYGRYPAWLLRSLSLDLRRSIDEAVRSLTS